MLTAVEWNIGSTIARTSFVIQQPTTIAVAIIEPSWPSIARARQQQRHHHQLLWQPIIQLP